MNGLETRPLGPDDIDDGRAAGNNITGQAIEARALGDRDVVGVSGHGLAAGDVVGAAVLVEEDGSGWVDQLAVARAHRGRGLAHALLLHAFALAWRLPNRECGLSTDSRTRARRLYEHAGMRVVRSYTQYARPL